MVAPAALIYLKAGSIWDESRCWMMGLLKKERVLVSFWDVKSTLPNHITSITLEASALSTEEGYILLTYELEGFEEYSESKKAKQGSVF